MYTANPYNAYKQNSVNMASKEQLLLMLVDGAVKYTKIAKLAIEKKDIQRAHKELVKSSRYIYRTYGNYRYECRELYAKIYSIFMTL